MSTVPSASHRLLYVMLIRSHDCGKIVQFRVTRHPTAARLSQHLAEVFPQPLPLARSRTIFAIGSLQVLLQTEFSASTGGFSAGLRTHEPPHARGFRSICKEFPDLGVGCGGGGIRTHGDLSATPVFKTGAFNRSATPPI